jgi:hypothetical protein
MDQLTPKWKRKIWTWIRVWLFKIFSSDIWMLFAMDLLCIFILQMNPSITLRCTNHHHIQLFYACGRESVKFNVGVGFGDAREKAPSREELVSCAVSEISPSACPEYVKMWSSCTLKWVSQRMGLPLISILIICCLKPSALTTELGLPPSPSPVSTSTCTGDSTHRNSWIETKHAQKYEIETKYSQK